MKLSANAREHVRNEIVRAFSDDKRKNDEDVKRFYERTEEKYRKFEADLEKTLSKCLSEVKKVIEWHGLTCSANDGEFNEDMHVELMMSGGRYSGIDHDCFTETTTCEHRSPELKSLLDIRRNIDGDIERAASKALFEIEVHGKKDTLRQIVDEVIAEIRKGK